jgi:hypothetical protein
LAIAGLLAGCGSKELTEAPPRGGATVAPATPESVVAAKATIAYARLAAEANKAAPANYTKADRVRPCVRVGPKGDLPFGGSYDLTKEVCQDVDYDIHVERTGPVIVGKGPTPGTVRATVEAKFYGQAGFTGDVARVLALDKKNFDGSFVAYLDIGVAMGPDWCPKLSVTPGFDWKNRARLEVMHNWNIDVSGKLGPEMQKQLEKMRDQLVAALDCAKVKAEIAKAFVPHALPIAIPNNGNVYLNVEPVGIGFSGITATDDALELALMITAKVAVATAAGPTAPKPLPPLTQVPLAPGKIVLAVPLQASYERLNAAIAPVLKDKTFTAATPAGKVSVTVHEVDVYPSMDKVAVRVKFAAATPGSWFDTRGNAYLAARPVVENNGTTIAFTDLRFSRAVDSALWTALSAIFENDIKGAIAKAAHVDLAGAIEQGKAALTAQLDALQKKSGVAVALTDTAITAGPITPTDAELIAQVRFESVANVTIAETP